MKRSKPSNKVIKRTTTIIVPDVNVHDHAEFKAWCSIHGFTVAGMIRVLMRECANGNIDHFQFDTTEAYRKVLTRAKRKKYETH